METPASALLARETALRAEWLARAAWPGALAHRPPGPGDDEDDDETPIGDPDEDDWEGEDWEEDDDQPLHAARQIAPAKRR
jgi:hypothetical protein